MRARAAYPRSSLASFALMAQSRTTAKRSPFGPGTRASASCKLTLMAFLPGAYSGEAGHPFRSKPITDSDKPITDSGQADHLRDDAGVIYFAAFLVAVKLSALRMDSPPSLRRWALWTSLSQMASARVASPITGCQSLGSSWLVRMVEPSW
jgi:hypothetical protein